MPPPSQDPRYLLTQGAASRDYRDYLADTNVDIGAYAQQAGFRFDPNTGVAGGIDPSNPYSRAALLQRTYRLRTEDLGRQRAEAGRRQVLAREELGRQRGESQRVFDVGRRGNVNRMAARGQLYSGALRNAQAETQRQFGERTGALGRAGRESEIQFGQRVRALGRAGDEAEFGYGQGFDTLRRGFDEFTRRWQRGRREAGKRRSDTIGYAGFDALERP